MGFPITWINCAPGIVDGAGEADIKEVRLRRSSIVVPELGLSRPNDYEPVSANYGHLDTTSPVASDLKYIFLVICLQIGCLPLGVDFE